MRSPGEYIVDMWQEWHGNKPVAGVTKTSPGRGVKAANTDAWKPNMIPRVVSAPAPGKSGMSGSDKGSGCDGGCGGGCGGGISTANAQDIAQVRKVSPTAMLTGLKRKKLKNKNRVKNDPDGLSEKELVQA